MRKTINIRRTRESSRWLVIYSHVLIVTCVVLIVGSSKKLSKRLDRKAKGGGPSPRGTKKHGHHVAHTESSHTRAAQREHTQL